MSPPGIDYQGRCPSSRQRLSAFCGAFQGIRQYIDWPRWGGRQLRASPLRRYPRVYVRTVIRLLGALWPICAMFLRMGIGRWHLSIAADAMLRHARIGLRGDAQAPILRTPCFGASQGQRIAINVFRR